MSSQRCRKIFDGTVNENIISELEPVVQCVQVKPLGSQTAGPERFRIVFSDITNYVQSMLGTRELTQGAHRSATWADDGL